MTRPPMPFREEEREPTPFPMRDAAFRPDDVLPRLRSSFSDATVVELEDAAHYFVEDAPTEVAAAVADRFLAR